MGMGSSSKFSMGTKNAKISKFERLFILINVYVLLGESFSSNQFLNNLLLVATNVSMIMT